MGLTERQQRLNKYLGIGLVVALALAIIIPFALSEMEKNDPEDTKLARLMTYAADDLGRGDKVPCAGESGCRSYFVAKENNAMDYLQRAGDIDTYPSGVKNEAMRQAFAGRVETFKEDLKEIIEWCEKADNSFDNSWDTRTHAEFYQAQIARKAQDIRENVVPGGKLI